MEMQDPTGSKLDKISVGKGKKDSSLSLEQWEDKWQEFLKVVDNPHSSWGIQRLPKKRSPWEDAKAFLASFEQVAEACQWPQEEWVTQLRPALSGEAEQAFNGLDVRDREDYGKVKAAILRGDAMSREKQRQQFRHFSYEEANGPRRAYSQLREMCRGWLRVEKHSKEQILELLILEQLLTILPPEIQSWVSEGGPESCSQAVALAEEFLLQQETQVFLEEAAETISEAGQAPSECEWRPLSKVIKEEEEGEASLLLADDVQENIGELLGLPWEKVKKEETEGNARNQDGPEGQEGSHMVEKRDKPISCQAEYFGELLVQQDEPTEKQRDNLLGVDGRICPGGKQSESVEFGNHVVERRDTSILCQVSNFSKTPVQQEMPAQKRKNKDHHAQGRNHMVEKQNENTELRNSFIKTRSHTSHHRIPTEENQYKCSKCGMTFSDAASFNAHLQMHSGEKPFQCLECGKNFRQKSHLRDHHRIHTGEKPHSCMECGKSFAFKSSLVRHQIIHSEDKWFTCSECGKNFSQKTKLTSHQRIHMVEEPYRCLECGMNFLNQTQFNIHLRMHHGKKPHQCLECGKTFLYRALLLRHQRMHTGEKPYECSECGKSFSAKSYLVIHQRIHSGEKPFKCTECGKRFRSRDKLTLHHRSHTGEKPYTCLECGKNFSQKKYLQRHQTIHTRGTI